MQTPIAIIGCGLAGLTAARTLVAAGQPVHIFDKGRASGGRLSSKHTDVGGIDMGGQYFTARSPQFLATVMRWEEKGWVSPWSPRIYRAENQQLIPSPDEQTRWVGISRMSALTRHLLGDLPATFSCRITEVIRGPKHWYLSDAEGMTHGPFSAVIVAVPAPQAASLLTPSPNLAAIAARVTMEPVWAVSLAFNTPLDTPVEAAFIKDETLDWATRSNSRPQREHPHDTWVLHASHAWSREHIDRPADEIIEKLSQHFSQLLGVELPEFTFSLAHRWLYARPTRTRQRGLLADEELGMYACGDWCLSGTIEDAWTSGMRAAHQLLANR